MPALISCRFEKKMDLLLRETSGHTERKDFRFLKGNTKLLKTWEQIAGQLFTGYPGGGFIGNKKWKFGRNNG
ncbi:MAG: hypothetical protein WC780_09120 [Lentimicrobiaceae bacterium]